MTEPFIQNRLFHKFGTASKLMIPNFTPNKDWWECDIARVLKSGYWNEFEIKLNVKDFNADKRKEWKKWKGWIDGKAEYEIKNKHSLLSEGDEDGPNNFNFVVPESIADKVTIPEWAGLMVCHKHHISIEKKAPRLHKKKISDSIEHKIRAAFYYRYWNQRIKA